MRPADNEATNNQKEPLMKLVQVTALLAIEDGGSPDVLLDYAYEFGVTVLEWNERPMTAVPEDPKKAKAKAKKAKPKLELAPKPKNSNYKGRPRPSDKLLRRALWLRYAQGKTFPEVGEVLGVARATASRYVRWGEEAGLEASETGEPPAAS
jgi:hypothetical protein